MMLSLSNYRNFLIVKGGGRDINCACVGRGV